MPKTPFDYELALSYAHKDEDIAAIISEELKNFSKTVSSSTNWQMLQTLKISSAAFLAELIML